jgi:flagellar basal-body rod modification protein FlgD
VFSINPVTMSAAQSSSSSDSKSTDAGTVDKTEFLKLLVTQLRNQDPMNPVENQEFVAQLATFSSLEQLIAINKAVTQLAGDQNGAATDTKNQKTSM